MILTLVESCWINQHSGPVQGPIHHPTLQKQMDCPTLCETSGSTATLNDLAVDSNKGSQADYSEIYHLQRTCSFYSFSFIHRGFLVGISWKPDQGTEDSARFFLNIDSEASIVWIDQSRGNLSDYYLTKDVIHLCGGLVDFWTSTNRLYLVIGCRFLIYHLPFLP